MEIKMSKNVIKNRTLLVDIENLDEKNDTNELSDKNDTNEINDPNEINDTNEINEINDTNESSERDDIKNLRYESLNLLLPLSKRVKYLSIYNKLNPDEIGELVNSIIGMYMFSKTFVLKEYIKYICEMKDIDIKNRIECAKSLCDIETKETEGYDYINRMFINEITELNKLSTPLRVDIVMFLMDSKVHRYNSKCYFIDNIIRDHSIEELYRLKLIQSLEVKFKINKDSLPLRITRRKGDKFNATQENKDDFIYFARDSCLSFVKDKRNTFTYRVIACQYLLEKCEVDEELSTFVEQFLLSVAEDVNMNEDLRADASDICLRYGSDKTRDIAMNIIIALGGEDNHNIFKNKQNVHNIHIEKSIQEIVDKLCDYHPKDKKVYNFNETKDSILKLINDEEKELKEKVEGSLIRISLDRALYGNSNMSLSNILLKVWTYVQDSPFKEDLEKRLIEELYESNNKCSTGFCGRLVNTLSGYDESMSIRISFEDQICSNLESKLNAKIREIQNEEYMEKILNEMTIPVIKYNLRLNFLRFFRDNISKIRQELYNEFCSYITDEDFDLYIRKGIIRWEGCE